MIQEFGNVFVCRLNFNRSISLDCD